MAITLGEAKRLRPGMILFHTINKNADGTALRWRVAGIPKVWKRSPERVRVTLKYGLWTYDVLTEKDLELISWR